MSEGTTQQALAKFAEVEAVYECKDHRHAVAILGQDFPDLFIELCDVLMRFSFPIDYITTAGGSESNIPKLFSSMLRPRGWKEERLVASVVVDGNEVRSESHKVDYVKGQVAVEMEWNSKDQTFDRDLYAFRSFFDYQKIAVGMLVTRSNDLDSLFDGLGSYVDKHGTRRRYKDKYGASTTHMRKLLPRLAAGRSGGCPVLAVGITQRQLERSNGQGMADPAEERR